VTAFPSHWYNRDPLDVLIQKEARSCKACVHEIREVAFGQTVMLCALGRKHGNRCGHYDAK
jgi:hypothetical protein